MGSGKREEEREEGRLICVSNITHTFQNRKGVNEWVFNLVLFEMYVLVYGYST